MNNGLVVPLRVAGGIAGVDGFRYKSWEQQASVQTRREFWQERKAGLYPQLEGANQRHAAFETWRQQQRFASAAACESISASSPVIKPLNVLDPVQWADAARKECVWSFKIMKGELEDARYMLAFLLRAYEEEQDRAGGGDASQLALLRARLQEADALVRDMEEFDPVTPPDFESLIKTTGLPLTTATGNALSNEGLLSLPSIFGLLDAYQSCLGDTEAQFKTALETWQREQDPRLLESRVEVQRQECRARFANDAQLREVIASTELQLKAADSQIVALDAAEFATLP